jgi:hypothetical protein
LALYLATALACVAAIGMPTSRPAQAQETVAPSADGKLDSEALRKMLEGMGFELKSIGTDKAPKWEFKVTGKGFDIPVGAELSSSRNYIWFTVLLNTDATKANPTELLKRNAKIQPSQFYVTTKGNLMMAVAIDNRAVTPAVTRRNIDTLSDNVSTTADAWNVSAQ